MKTKSKEKDIEKKEKKTTNNKLSLVLDIIFILLSIASGIYLIVALFQYISIKDLKIIIYIVTAIIILFNLIMIINLFRKKKKKKRIKKSIKRFLLSILIVITIFIGYTLNYITKSLNNANKEFVTTSISLITLKENKVTDPKNIKNSKIAIGSDTEDLAMYKLPWEIINKYDIDEYNKILGYEDYASMIRDLYSGEVDYIFLPTNYGVLYEEEEG